MGNHWMAIHESMVRTISSQIANQQFKTVCKIHIELSGFDDPSTLVKYLNNTRGDLDTKDGVYRSLVKSVQSCSDWSGLANALLWLGLWPGLTKIYGTRLPDFKDRPDELAAEISFIFIAMINRIDLAKVNRLASTLIRNVKRDLREGLKRRWARDARRADLLEEEKLGTPDSNNAFYEPSELGLPPGLTAEEEVAAIRDQLAPLVGIDNVDLMIGVAIYGESQSEMGEQLGINRKTVRKRLDSTIKRIREWMK